MKTRRLLPRLAAFAILISLALVAPAVLQSREPEKSPRAALIVPTTGRIAAIRAWVGDGPVGPGRPISDRAAWREAAGRLDEKELLTEADKISGQPTPELPDDLFLLYASTGSRREYQHAFEQRRSRLSVLVWAEGVEAHGRFLPAIARELAAILSEKTWVLPAHDPLLGNFHGSVVEVDLGAATRGWTLALVDYWLGERLPAELRARLRAELRRRVIAPYLAVQHGGPRSRGFGWITTSNNWNAVCHAGVIGTALALGGAPDECAELIAAAELNLCHYYDGFTSEGYCDEGIAYWNYGFGHCVMLAETVAQATGGQVRLLAGPKARLITKYPQNLEITPGVFPVFSDGGLTVQPSPFVRQLAERQFGTSQNVSPAVQPKLSATQGRLYEAAFEIFLPLSSAARTEAVRPLRLWFANAQVLIAHATSGFGAAIKGSHNGESHNHNDIGSFVIAAGQTAPVLDPGGEVYTARTFGTKRYDSKVLNSYGHNVPLVAGQMQGTGREYVARVIATEFGETTDRLVLDLHAAYSVPALVSLQRNFALVRGAAPAVTVTDTVQFDSPQTFGTALITFGPWREIKPGQLLLGEGPGAVRVDFSATGADVRLRPEIIDECLPGGGKPIRLGLDLATPVTRGSIRVQIMPASRL